jgi:hypothetical protein
MSYHEKHLFETVNSVLEVLCAAPFSGVLAFLAQVVRDGHRHAADYVDDVILAYLVVAVGVVNLKDHLELLIEAGAVKSC